MDLKKGNLIFLKNPLADLLYVVKEMNGEKVIARKLDAPSKEWEELPTSEIVKLAEEQERLLPSSLLMVVDEQRRIVFAPPKKSGKKKSLDQLMKGLSKDTVEEILGVLSEAEVGEEKEVE